MELTPVLAPPAPRWGGNEGGVTGATGWGSIPPRTPLKRDARIGQGLGNFDQHGDENIEGAEDQGDAEHGRQV